MTEYSRHSNRRMARFTLPPLMAIVLLLAGIAGGLVPVDGSAPAAAPASDPAYAGATIPNLTLVKSRIVNYHESGAWDGDIYRTLRPAQEYLLENLHTGDRPAIVFDIDDTLLSNYATLKDNDFGRVIPLLRVAIDAAAFPPIPGALDLYRTAVAHGVAVFLISGRAESLREATARNLAIAGITDYVCIYLQPDDAPPAPSVVPFKSGARRAIVEQGYRILVNVGDQESDLAGGWAERTYKLPNPMYFIP